MLEDVDEVTGRAPVTDLNKIRGGEHVSQEGVSITSRQSNWILPLRTNDCFLVMLTSAKGRH